MQPVAVRILHPVPDPASGRLVHALAEARRTNADRLAALFGSVGVGDVRIEEGLPDGRPFGVRLRDLVRELPARAGLVVLGSGSVPLLSRRGAAELAAVAASGERRGLANNRFSADVVAVGDAAILASVPDLPGDNGLPRWLEEFAGTQVDDMRRRWRLAVDLDSPLDVILAALPLPGDVDRTIVDDRIARLRATVADPRAELVVAGRTSAATLRWLERRTASRTRALVEERGLRAVDSGAPGAQRPPRSVLGLVLDARGPGALGSVLEELGDAAMVDTRVLLAHRLGTGEGRWPAPDDRFASDLLLVDEIRDPWLRALTASARDSAIPVLLGGHTLVGPGVRLLLGGRR